MIDLVQFGPGLAGQTTNLERLASSFGGTVEQGRLAGFEGWYVAVPPMSVASTLAEPVRLWRTSTSLHEPAGQADAWRAGRAFLFVADAQEARQEANREQLERFATAWERDVQQLSHLPGAVQYTKTDTPTALPRESLDRRLNEMNWPSLASVPVEGLGVDEALDLVLKAFTRNSSVMSPGQQP